LTTPASQIIGRPGASAIALRTWLRDLVTARGAAIPEWRAAKVSAATLGWQLVEPLVEQLDGHVEVRSPPGTRVTLTFSRQRH